jgi:hypothetical protein
VLARVIRSLDVEPDPDRAAFRRADVVRLLLRIADEVGG